MCLKDRMREYEGRKVLILGMARSGVSAAGLLSRAGAGVICADENASLDAPERLDNLELRLGPFKNELLEDRDEIVLSPGIPSSHPFLRVAVEKGIPIVSELEIGYRFAEGPVIAVTGTNGKSTTVSMIEAILRKAGYDAVAAGNIGKPFCSVVERSGRDRIFVIEASSFQLETISDFKPEVAGILNLTPDHLDRYESEEEYYTAKTRIIENCDSGDYFFYNAGDSKCVEIASGFPGRAIAFSSRSGFEKGFSLEGDWLALASGSGVRRDIMKRDELKVIGLHNVENALAAIAAVDKYGIAPETCREALSAFKGLKHRMERVATIDGVDYFDDSKATNVEGTVMSLKDLDSPAILIAGGLAKGSDFGKLLAVSDNILHAILIGSAAPLIEEAIKGSVPSTRARTMMEAVTIAREKGRPGQYVVLSPACASFDMFRDYRHRGDVFRDAVAKIKDGSA